MSKTPLFCTSESPAMVLGAGLGPPRGGRGSKGRRTHERRRATHADHARRTQSPPSPSGDLVATRKTTTYLVRTRWGTRPGRGCVVEEEEEGETAGGSRLGRSLCAFPVVSVCVEGGGNVRVAVVLRDRRMLRCALNGLDLGLFLLSYESATRLPRARLRLFSLLFVLSVEVTSKRGEPGGVSDIS